MQILVTGGAGFIGGHLAEGLISQGHDVIVLDNFDDYYQVKLKRHNVEQARAASDSPNSGDYELIEGDVRDEDTVSNLVGTADVVFHQAAQAGVRASTENPKKPNNINVGGTLNVLEAARHTDIERIVVASSSSVYGKAEYLPYDEEHPTTPVSPYGVSKLAGEQYTRVFAEVYGLPTVALRYFTVYGPRMRPNMAISNFVSNCMNGEPPVVYGDGTQTRDFTYIDDIVEANYELINTGAADGEVLNIGSSDNIEIQELANIVRDEIAPELDIEYGDRNPADAEHTHADISKAASLIDYKPTYTIQEGVSKFIDWYHENQEWYEPLIRP